MPARRFSCLLVIAAASLLPSGRAFAGVLVASAPDCDAQPLSQPFRPWADPASYTPAPGGVAESASGWAALSDSARISQGNEPWNVHAAKDRRHLALGPGSFAATGVLCVGIEHPTVRFFARSNAADPTSILRVGVLFETTEGDVVWAGVGSISATGSWAPSPVFPVAANLFALLPGDNTPVAFTFTPAGSASWQVDDVYVDPFGRT
jgi:hypothetical protein